MNKYFGRVISIISFAYLSGIVYNKEVFDKANGQACKGTG